MSRATFLSAILCLSACVTTPRPRPPEPTEPIVGAKARQQFDDVAAMYKREGATPGVMKSLDQLVEAQPGFAQAWFNLGVVAEERGDRDRARVAYKRAAEQSVEFPYGTIPRGEDECSTSEPHRRPHRLLRSALLGVPDSDEPSDCNDRGQLAWPRVSQRGMPRGSYNQDISIAYKGWLAPVCVCAPLRGGTSSLVVAGTRLPASWRNVRGISSP